MWLGLPSGLDVWALFWFVLFFNGEKRCPKGCLCILSPSKLIGLENELVHRPGLIGIKHKYMEWSTALAVGLTVSINVCEGNRIRKMCVFVQVCASTDIKMSRQVCLCWFWVPLRTHQPRLTHSKQGQWKHVISFRTEDTVT